MQELLDWCSSLVAPLPGAELALVQVAGDASFRRYYRLRGCEPPRIAVHAPPEHEKNPEFVHIAALLRASGVNAPRVEAYEEHRGFLLISDFGDALLLPALDEHSVDGLYRRALDTLLRMQTAAVEHQGWRLPDYDEAALRREMELFPQWYLQRLLGIVPDAAERALIESVFARLVASALEQPQVFVHRDYHSRNIMLLPSGELGVIDFQDAVRGAVTYDLVSLLRDCYVRWPPERVSGWMLQYRERAMAESLIGVVEPERFRRWFDWMGLQRHIKVLGIFARLWLRDGKPGYLRDLPLVMRYTLEVSGAYPELAEFDAWFRERVLPLAQTQQWYSTA